MSVNDFDVIEIKLSSLSAQVTELWDHLMSHEMQLVDQLEVKLHFCWFRFLLISRFLEFLEFWDELMEINTK